MFGRNKKFSVQGKLLIKLLKENLDWAVYNAGASTGYHIDALHSPKYGICLYVRGNQIGIIPKAGDTYVYEAFNAADVKEISPIIARIIKEVKDSKVVISLQQAISSLSCKSER